MPKDKPEKFLSEKYQDLPGSKEVRSAVRKKISKGEKGPQSKEDLVGVYLDRIQQIISSGNRVSTERGWELLKRRIIKEFSIDADDPDTLTKIAHGLYEAEKRLAIEQGRGAEVERLEQHKDPETELLESYKNLTLEKRDIQNRTLSAWLEYLRQNDAGYPMWFRYFVIRNLAKMGVLDKEKQDYATRTRHTVAPFPEVNSEYLGFTYRMLTQGISKDEFTESPQKHEKLQELINKKDFAKLYAFAQLETAGHLNKESLEGQWVKYEQGSDHHILEKDLRGKGTGWCTAEGSAYTHIQGGDFYVYYTKNPNGQYTEPRIAIRTENGNVAEVRGVNHRQELEPQLIDTAQEKYHELPGGEKFDKKSQDMKRITELTQKHQKGEQLTKDDLIFLYEIDSPIEGFGYQKDPRIEKLRSQRNPEQDMPIVFECQGDQIAHTPKEITKDTKAKDTKAYVGKLEPGIFNLIQQFNIEHVYTSFPEGRIRLQELEIGGKDTDTLIKEMKEKGINISSYAEDMLRSKDFTTAKTPEHANLVRLTVKDLGFDQGATTDQIYQRAQELGLELCPAEVGPHLRLKYTDQPLGEWFWIGMKQISGRDGNPNVFYLNRLEGGLWLSGNWAGPGGGWYSAYGFVFRIPPQ